MTSELQNITEEYLKRLRANALSSSDINRKAPDVLIVDLRPIFVRYSPSASIQTWLYRNDVILRKFVEQLTIHRLVEAGFVMPYDSLGQECILWEVIESLFPEGTGEFENSSDSMCGLQVLFEAIVEEVDNLLREKTEIPGLSSVYQDYVFDRWITQSAAAFTHRDFQR